MAIYGCAMYVSPSSGKYYVFVSSESGQVQQWELFDNGAGKADATLVRSFSVGSRVEGIVADDVLGHLYVGEENDGIWKYSAEPGGGAARTFVDGTGGGGHLSADVEGLTIYYAANGAGYLIASRQGSSEFVVYERGGNNAFVGSFKLVSGGGIDAVSDTDGIDVTNFSLGSQFPSGMFVAQDNDDNFKFAGWDAIDAAFGGSLLTDTMWDPRSVGKQPEPNPLPGDFNRSGIVDAADYVVWRKTLGSSGVPAYSGADGDGDGTIDDEDYGVWRAGFGEVLIPPNGGEEVIDATIRPVFANWAATAVTTLTNEERRGIRDKHVRVKSQWVDPRGRALLAWLASVSNGEQKPTDYNSCAAMSRLREDFEGTQEAISKPFEDGTGDDIAGFLVM